MNHKYHGYFAMLNDKRIETARLLFAEYLAREVKAKKIDIKTALIAMAIASNAKFK